jgi:predicted Zn-dependent protease
MRSRIRFIRLAARQAIAVFVALQLALATPVVKDEPRQPEKVGKGLNFFSQDQEVAMGRSYSEQLNRQLDLVTDPYVQDYVERTGQRLVAASLRKDLQYHFFVVNTTEVNAFALPGGYIYVNRGLMDRADNESELAGVMAHEIGHVAGKHSLKQLSKRLLLTGIVVGAGLGVGAKSKKWGEIVAAAGGIGVFFTSLKYSRDDEREADWLGLTELNQAGYDPWGMVTFFEKLEAMQKEKGGGMPGFLSTHPLPAERKANMRKQIAELNLGGSDRQVAVFDFERCKQTLAALPAAPAGREKTLSNALAALGQPSDDSASAAAGQGQGVGYRSGGSRRGVAVPGDSVWVDTGIDLLAGDTVEVWAKGQVYWKKNSEDSCGPEGIPGKGFWKPISKANTAALIGRIGADSFSYFVVGAHFRAQALTAGRLYLGINDDNNLDNRGGYEAEIQVSR